LNITKKKDLTGGRPLSQKQRMTAMEIEPAADSSRNRGSYCSGQGTATQTFKILCGLSNILNITKENRGRNSGRTDAGVAAERAGGSGLRPRQQWQCHRPPMAATAGAGNGDKSRGSMRAENEKVVAIAAETLLVASEMAAAVVVAAAMATVAMVATTRQQWQW